ncbi:hypothetical protein SHKM778_27730 [Streptomyces sp. KM77-8]|uniref:SDR family NAD(P)-dependent oxidoreductase n=1 Tax=Streptomyces haneummycinicus TaxID=3074435 RepID=A0AAT9HG37_9ACTN
MPVVRRPLAGRVAVVTGAARGLGAALAEVLVERGARVALLGREERTLARVRDALPEGTSVCWQADVTDDRGMHRVGAEIRARLGPPRWSSRTRGWRRAVRSPSRIPPSGAASSR